MCVSADPRRSGSAEGGENFIINAEELRLSLQAQCKEEDQVVWMTTAQADFPTTTVEGELDNDLDRQRGKPTTRCLHPAISAFILQRQQELSTQDQSPSMTESRALELESEWDTQEERMEVSAGPGGALSQTCPKGENDLGWVQLQQKSLLCQEKIEGSLVVTHEGLTTMTQSSKTGWTIMSGTWNHLRKVWGPTPDTLSKIQASCR